MAVEPMCICHVGIAHERTEILAGAILQAVCPGGAVAPFRVFEAVAYFGRMPFVAGRRLRPTYVHSRTLTFDANEGRNERRCQRRRHERDDRARTHGHGVASARRSRDRRRSTAVARTRTGSCAPQKLHPRGSRRVSGCDGFKPVLVVKAAENWRGHDATVSTNRVASALAYSVQ